MACLTEIYLASRRAFDKILGIKGFNIAENPKYDGYQRDLASMVYKFFDKKTSGSGIKNEHFRPAISRRTTQNNY